MRRPFCARQPVSLLSTCFSFIALPFYKTWTVFLLSKAINNTPTTQTLPIYGIVQLINDFLQLHVFLGLKFSQRSIFFVENWQTITKFLPAQDLPGVPALCCHAIRQLPPPPIDPQKMFPANIATTAANKQPFTRDTPSMIFFGKKFFLRECKAKILSFPVKKCVTRDIAIVQ